MAFESASQAPLCFHFSTLSPPNKKRERSPGLDQIIEYGLPNKTSLPCALLAHRGLFFRIQAHINSGVGILRFRSCGFWAYFFSREVNPRATCPVCCWTGERYARVHHIIGMQSGILLLEAGSGSFLEFLQKLGFETNRAYWDSLPTGEALVSSGQAEIHGCFQLQLSNKKFSYKERYNHCSVRSFALDS